MREEEMNCEEICELLTAYLDGEVTPEEKMNIEAHLPGCPQCRAELEALSATQSSLRGAFTAMADEVFPSTQAWEKVRPRLETKESRRGFWSAFTLGRVAAATAVVVILVIAVVVWQFGGIFEMGAPAPKPAPAPEPTPEPEPPEPFEVHLVPEEAYYLPGEPVEVTLSLSNVSSEPITLEPYPPEIRVTPQSNYDRLLFSVAAGTQPLQIEPGDAISRDFAWDQKDTEGKQVAPGWYNVIFKDMNVTQGNSSCNFNPTSRILIQYPQGTMEKTIELNQSRTVNDITITLGSIELTVTGMTVNAFGTLPGYRPPPAASPFMYVFAEYSIDNGVVKQAGSAGMQELEDGTGLIWSRYVDPVPSDAQELIFRIDTITLRNFSPDKPDELVVGPWEFTVPLGGDSDDSSASQNVTFSQLVSQADRYNGKVITLDAFYFYYDVMHIGSLAGSAELESSNEGKVVPVGTLIRVKRDISQELQNQLYTLDGASPRYLEYFGKLRITGKFEIDNQDGQYLITITGAEVLEWTPPQAGTATPTGNLQIKIQEFSSKPLQGAEVVSGKQPDGQPKLSGLTDSDGMVTFDDIKQGRYEFTVSLADYIQMDIRVAVTGGRTASVAFHMARVGEAPDDFVPAPGMGPQYRANVLVQGVTNPWPPILGTEVTMGAPPNTAQITYRDYIESEAGQTRNNMFITRLLGVDPDDATLDAIEVNLKGTALPSGITVIQDWQWHYGPISKTALKIVISPQVEPGEHTFNINVEVDGKDYGTVPCTIEVVREPYPGNHGITTTKVEPKPGDNVTMSSGLVVRLTLDDLVEKSDATVIGKVVDIFPSRLGTEPLWSSKMTIFTDVIIETERYLYGKPKSDYIAVRVMGGRVDEIIIWVEDEPVFTLGEEAVLFLTRVTQPNFPPEGIEPDNYYRVTGAMQGKLGYKNGNMINLGGGPFAISEIEQKIAERAEGAS